MGLLKDYVIRLWPLGGDNMSRVDVSLFVENYDVVAIVDRDPGSGKSRRKFAKKCEELNIECHRLERYSFENYFTVDALREVFKGQIPDDFETIDPDEKLSKQLNVGTKSISNTKKIAQVMNLKDIEGTDMYDFLEKVRQRLASKSA